MDLADGFSTYTTTSKSIASNEATSSKILQAANNRSLSPEERREKIAQTQATLALAKDSADILLNSNGNLVQTLLVEESVRATSAQVKDNLRSMLVDNPQRFRDSLPLGVGSFLPALPFEKQISPFLGKTEDEINAQQLADKLLSLVTQQQVESIRGGNKLASVNAESLPPGVSTLVADLDAEQLAMLSRELRESAPKYFPLAGLLGAKFVEGLLQSVAANIDAGLAEIESRSEQSDAITTVTARGLSTAAKRGADVISDHVINSPSISEEFY